jgi:hypothetical protein
MADLMSMLTLILLFAIQVTTPREMSCADSIQDVSMPSDLYVVGSADEGTVNEITKGQILYLNGPKISSLKTGDINRIVRPAEKVRDPLTGNRLGVYYKDIGSIHIEAVNRDNAVARVISSCEGIVKGDLVLPSAPKPMVYFQGELSNELTQLPENGLIATILMGKNDIKYLTTGQLCFLGRGSRDGVKSGDRFTVFRPQPHFDSRDISITDKMSTMLQKRKLPSKILGDIIIVDAGDKVSTGKVINSLFDMHPGDLAIKR